MIEFNPLNSEIVWRYEGTRDNPLDSDIRSSQQRLANGNTFIVESSGGRMVEVTPHGDIAWEFLNPVRGGKNGDQIPIISGGERIMPQDLDPDFVDPLLSAARTNNRSNRT